MVGRDFAPHYRRRMNFLSRCDYTRPRTRYKQIRIQPIVLSMTGPYHASVTPEQILFSKRGIHV